MTASFQPKLAPNMSILPVFAPAIVATEAAVETLLASAEASGKRCRRIPVTFLDRKQRLVHKEALGILANFGLQAWEIGYDEALELKLWIDPNGQLQSTAPGVAVYKLKYAFERMEQEST